MTTEGNGEEVLGLAVPGYEGPSLPDGTTPDLLLAAARQAARNSTCGRAQDAWKAEAGGGGVMLRQAVDAVGGMVFKNIVDRAERSWKTFEALKDIASANTGAARLKKERTLLWSVQGEDPRSRMGFLYLELGEPGLILRSGEAEEGDDVRSLTVSAFYDPPQRDVDDCVEATMDLWEPQADGGGDGTG
jgi:hypothetical protein